MFKLSKERLVIIIVATTFIVIGGSATALKLTVFKNDPKKTKNVSIVKASPSPSASPSLTPTPTPTPSVAKAATTNQTSVWPVVLSLDQAESLTVVVNKKHQLPSNYSPPDLVSVPNGLLRSDAAKAYSQISADAAANGFTINVISSYRSYQTQVSTYNGFAARDGQALADTYSARPGHSEHQTGLAVDIGISGGNCSLQSCFGDTAVGQWLAANGAKYGFIVRYPKGKDAITGYQYEPWHLRYLGTEIARAVEATGKTLDEFYTVPAGGYQ
ncbi:MAG: M15 family metallopeptidase [Candidatus Saccharibacteria bacterium]